MNRRELLRLLALGVVSHTLDIDKLLWVPGQKTIFIPSKFKGLSYSYITDIKMARLAPQIQIKALLFERNCVFYIEKKEKK